MGAALPIGLFDSSCRHEVYIVVVAAEEGKKKKELVRVRNVMYKVDEDGWMEGCDRKISVAVYAESTKVSRSVPVASMVRPARDLRFSRVDACPPTRVSDRTQLA